jgi:hypothetical protein
MRPVLAGIFVAMTFFTPHSAFANWWLVRSSDGKCLVVDIEPTGKDKTITKIGKDVYQSAERAEQDAKKLCKEAKPPKRSAPYQ